MAYIYNPTKEEQTVKVFGNYFSFKPGQIKNLNPDISHFIQTERRESGLVQLPEDEAGELWTFKGREVIPTEAGKVVLAEEGKKGVDAYIAFHRSIIANNQVALRRDLEQANIKVDPAVYASPGELRSMKLVAKYQQQEADAEQARIDEVRELMKKAK